MAASEPSLRMLYWVSRQPDRAWLRERGFAVIGWDAWRNRRIEASGSPALRATARPPADPPERFPAAGTRRRVARGRHRNVGEDGQRIERISARVGSGAVDRIGERP